MFDFGIGELIVIFAVALIVVGPDKLPQIAKTLGKGLGELKKSMDNIKGQVHEEFSEIKDTSGIKDALDGGIELRKSLQDIKEQVKTDFAKAVDTTTELPGGGATNNTAEAAEGKNEDKVSQ